MSEIVEIWKSCIDLNGIEPEEMFLDEYKDRTWEFCNMTPDKDTLEKRERILDRLEAIGFPAVTGDEKEALVQRLNSNKNKGYLDVKYGRYGLCPLCGRLMLNPDIKKPGDVRHVRLPYLLDESGMPVLDNTGKPIVPLCKRLMDIIESENAPSVDDLIRYSLPMKSVSGNVRIKTQKGTEVKEVEKPAEREERRSRRDYSDVVDKDVQNAKLYIEMYNIPFSERRDEKDIEELKNKNIAYVTLDSIVEKLISYNTTYPVDRLNLEWLKEEGFVDRKTDYVVLVVLNKKLKLPDYLPIYYNFSEISFPAFVLLMKMNATLYTDREHAISKIYMQ